MRGLRHSQAILSHVLTNICLIYLIDVNPPVFFELISYSVACAIPSMGSHTHTHTHTHTHSGRSRYF